MNKMNKQKKISNNKKDLGRGGAELLQMKDYNIEVKKWEDQRQRELINWKRDLNKVPRIYSQNDKEIESMKEIKK